MCLCKGTGGIKQMHQSAIEFIPCPDTNCEFDREKSEREFEAVCEEFGVIKKRKEGVAHAQ